MKKKQEQKAFSFSQHKRIDFKGSILVLRVRESAIGVELLRPTRRQIYGTHFIEAAPSRLISCLLSLRNSGQRDSFVRRVIKFNCV